MKLTTLLLFVAAMTGVSLASPHHHRYGAGAGPAQYQQSFPTPMDIHELCTLARIRRVAHPLDVFLTHCLGQQDGGFQYSFCRLSPDQILKIVSTCPPSRSGDVIFANHQQQLYDPAIIGFFQKLAQFCFLVQMGNGLEIPSLVVDKMVERLCLEAPGSERISQVLPFLGQMVDQTTDFCNHYQSFPPEVLLSIGRSKCEEWGHHLESECISQPNLCIAIFDEP